MNPQIADWLNSYSWPCINSVIYGDGKMVLLKEYFDFDSKYQIGPIADTTIDSFIKYNPDELTNFDVFDKDTEGDLVVKCGDGSYEDEGIIYVCKENSAKTVELIWFCFFEKSTPFINVAFDKNGFVNAISKNKARWKISINNPALEVSVFYP